MRENSSSPPLDAPPASEHDRLGVVRAATRAHCAVENRRKLRRGAVDGRGRELFTARPAASDHALGASIGDRARMSIRRLRPFLSVLAGAMPLPVTLSASEM